ncbi:MAG: DUF72 domain-containing protein [Myxococcales bacterium]|nr:DUF72 domain-containing protein [Myxococcales bacterium]
MQFLVGTSGFAYPQWKGRFYPPELPEDDYLGYYAARLATVEINNTFYRMPGQDVVAKWRAQAARPDFRFVWKASRRISHQAKLKPPEAHDSMAYLWRMAEPLGEQLGPVLIQTPPYLGRTPASCASSWPRRCRPGARWRSSWRRRAGTTTRSIRCWPNRGCARCIADKDDGTARLVVTAPWVYVRLRKDDYADAELSGWLVRLRAGGGVRVGVLCHEDTARGVEPAQALAGLAAGA